MKEADFDELIESVREAGRILRGEAEPSRELPINAPCADAASEPEAATTPSDDERA
ncbi:MAG TPA: hypothetical protein VGQ46_02935 [Thermoanaerobaculia bacterium]|jgi:hypothetical protein|nr:hypothetical protein [Thermoanaerobaculia bacterium]